MGFVQVENTYKECQNVFMDIASVIIFLATGLL